MCLHQDPMPPTTADATAINNVCGVMPCIIMTISGRPFWLTDAQFDAAKAVVASWVGSSEGDGMADVLFGDKNFTGRLPMSWSRSVEQEPINVGDANYDPRFPFGWGLRAGTGFSTKSSLQAARTRLPRSAVTRTWPPRSPTSTACLPRTSGSPTDR